MPAKILQLSRAPNFRVVAYHFALLSGPIIFSLPATEDGLFDADDAAVKIAGMKLNHKLVRVYSEIESKQVSDLFKEAARISELVTRTMLVKGNLNLTPREKEVLSHILQGKSNKIIASDIFLTVRTVKFHVSKLLEKFGVASRNDLVLWYQNQKEEVK